MIVVSYWIERFREQATFGPLDNLRIPDHTLEYITLTSFDYLGVPRYRIEAPLMTHFDDDDSTELESPMMLIFRPSSPPFEVRSERAWMSSGRTEIFLMGEVTIIRKGIDAQATTTIKTQNLRVFPRREFASTEKSILATNARYRIRGQGGSINLRNGKVKIFHQAKGLYEP